MRKMEKRGTIGNEESMRESAAADQAAASAGRLQTRSLSSDLPPSTHSFTHFGWRPRPVHCWDSSSGLR
jgi:hypothetical protein